MLIIWYLLGYPNENLPKNAEKLHHLVPFTVGLQIAIRGHFQNL